ncbi:hypothetical protein C3747_356g13 [Trypanosoma cruzi]|uniref:Uncharacterized protein n=2 Tax=Trypanosoma cruzi TaxID=5693 RepID=Q4CSF1_TRYCC|nr:hypothetical protein, conserved [Trypanosoma cruzi]EAN83202.1 hypothetical protein, conserved [Trypanosoma cruzi]PWU90828.1 hypothetical protein C3747_356g13 [Trypanosoma cruzi]RNC59156.1 hypothetical protein TcCL_ESM03224 [Trypanosoma cruzi]|eukprot:XP_805053.1 hypothetical protein [Trypanosoma cruzi strain CL Brener]
MRRTFSYWASRAWRVHSELIQGWIAAASSEPRKLQQARSYLYDLKLEDAIEEVEDATDLVYFMHRVSYPAGSHLETKVGQFLSRLSEQLTRENLLEIVKRLNEQPNSGPLWSRVVFEQPWFSGRVEELLEGLTLEEHVTFCAVVWRSLLPMLQSHSSQHATRGAAVAVSQQLALLTAQRIERSNDCQAVCLCAQLGVPLQGESLAVLRELILSLTRGGNLSPEQMITVAEGILAHHSTDAEWLDALQVAICGKPLGSVSASHAIAILRAVTSARSGHLSKMFEDLLLRVLPDMSPEDMLGCCRSLTVMPNAAPCLRKELQRLLCSKTSLGKGASDRYDDALLLQLRGMSLIAPSEATKLLLRFVDQLKGTEKISSPSMTQILLRCMRDLQLFPPELVSHCKNSFLQNTPSTFTQEDIAYLLYAAARAGEAVDGIFFNELLNRFAATRKFDRRKHKAYHGNLLSIPTVTMVLESFNVAKGGRLSVESKVYAVLRDAIEQQQQQQRPEGIKMEDAMHILKLLVHLGVDDRGLTTLLLTRLSKAIGSMTPIHVRTLCEVLVALKSRDVLMFRALLSHLSQISPDHESITSTALTARKLKFVPYFEQSVLVEHVTSIEGWSLSDIVLVACTCSEKQRKAFLALPGAEVLSQARPEELSTLDLFLLLSISNEDREKTAAIAATLRSRPPIAAGDLEVEDVWRAFVNVADDKEALAAVCRSGAATLQTADENTLMRFLEAASNVPELPNVFFRVVGRTVLRLANNMTVENALRWLELYVGHQIRDDSVGKALLSKVRTRSHNAASLVDKTLRKASTMYGKTYNTQGKLRKNKEKVEWRYFHQD